MLIPFYDGQKLFVTHDDRGKVDAKGLDDIAIFVPNAAPLERWVGRVGNQARGREPA